MLVLLLGDVEAHWATEEPAYHSEAEGQFGRTVKEFQAQLTQLDSSNFIYLYIERERLGFNSWGG